MRKNLDVAVHKSADIIYSVCMSVNWSRLVESVQRIEQSLDNRGFEVPFPERTEVDFFTTAFKQGLGPTKLLPGKGNFSRG